MPDDDEIPEESPMLEAVKDGAVLRLSRDPHPDTTSYMVIEGPGLLVLFPKNGKATMEAPKFKTPHPTPGPEPDRNGHLCRAFAVLENRISASPWTSSPAPFTDLTASLAELAHQPDVAVDVDAYLGENPDVENAAEMLFTSIAMSARADWRSTPAEVRGVAARGWFLGRWVPTFLVLDGPILRLLMSPAFRRQNPQVPLLRAVRKFFQTKEFMLLRHAFAHWSFKWQSAGDDSIIVGTDGATETVRATRGEADAFHIVTYALIEAIDDVFLRGRRPKRLVVESAEHVAEESR